MATFTDDFNRANNADLGAVWDAGYTSQNTAQIVSNEVRSQTLGVDAYESYNGASFGNDQFARLTWGTSAGAEFRSISPMVRMTAPASLSGYGVACWAPADFDTSEMFKWVADSFTELVSEAGTIWATGDTAALEASGTDLRLVRNGSLLLATTDSSLTSGRVGLGVRMQGAGALADVGINAFVGGDLVRPWLVGAGALAATATSGTGLSPAYPAGYTAVEGDIALLLCHHSANGPFNTPSGYAIATTGTPIDDNNTAAQRVTVFWKRLTASEAAPSVALTTQTVTTVRGCRLLILRGCRATDPPFEVAARNLNAAANTISFPTVTSTVDQSLVVALGAYEDDPTTWPAPAGWEGGTVVTSALGNDMALGHFLLHQVTAGASGAVSTGTLTGGTFANSPSVGAVLSFPPVAEVPAFAGVPWVRPPFVRRGPLEVRAV